MCVILIESISLVKWNDESESSCEFRMNGRSLIIIHHFSTAARYSPLLSSLLFTFVNAPKKCLINVGTILKAIKHACLSAPLIYVMKGFDVHAAIHRLMRTSEYVCEWTGCHFSTLLRRVFNGQVALCARHCVRPTGRHNLKREGSDALCALPQLRHLLALSVGCGGPQVHNILRQSTSNQRF